MTTPTTTPIPLLTTDYRTAVAFTSCGASYDTLAAVATRLAILAIDNATGAITERVTGQAIFYIPLLFVLVARHRKRHHA